MELEELVARATTGLQSQYCWASRLEGDAADYVERVTALNLSGEKVNGAQVHRDLEEFFDLSVDVGGVRTHLNGKCRTCRK